MLGWVRVATALALLAPTIPAAPSISPHNNSLHRFFQQSSSSSQHSDSSHSGVTVGDHDAGSPGDRLHQSSVTPSVPAFLHDDGSAGVGADIGDLLASAAHGRVPAWLKRSTTIGALTSSRKPTTQPGDGLVDGVVVAIAPRFVVTSIHGLSGRGRQCLRDGSVEVRAVVFNGDAVKVKSVQFESDYYKNDSYGLVVLELERELKPSAVRPLSIVTSKRNTDFEFEHLTSLDVSSVLDTKAVNVAAIDGQVAKEAPKTQTKLTFFVEPMCGYQRPRQDVSAEITELCVGQLQPTVPSTNLALWSQAFPVEGSRQNSRRNLAAWQIGKDDVSSAGHSSVPVGSHWLPSAVNSKPSVGGGGASTSTTGASSLQVETAAILLYNDELVGLSIPNKTPSGMFKTVKGEKQGFVRLAADVHRIFLDFATSQTITYDDDDVFSKLSKYPSYLATFVDSSDRKLPCQAVLIASKFVLTTASCLDAQPTVNGVMFYDADPAQRRIVRIIPTHVAKHSRYTAGDASFDTAVMELETSVSFAPIALDDGSASTNSSYARIQVSDSDECELSATTWNSNANGCRNSQGNKYMANEAICGFPATATGSRFSAKDFVGDSSIAKVVDQSTASAGAALVKLCEISNVALVGLSVAASSSGSSSSSHRSLTDSSGEVYVRVANSATFINAYVSGTSWSLSPGRMADLTVANLPADLQFIVGLRTTEDGQNFCGGSLIGPSTVLTAAHCVVDGPASYVSIGAYQSSGVENEVIAILKDKTKTHTLYGTPHKFSYDVAILELAYPSAMNPVLLDDTADFLQRESATMYGYGMASATSGLSATVRAVTVPLWSAAACATVYGSEVDDSMLCAGGEKGKDACTGDSGSPLIETRDGKNVLVGVVSAGTSCGLENIPGVYARVSHVKDFIKTRAIGANWAASSGETPASGGDTGSASTVTTPPPTTTSGNNITGIEAREATDKSSSTVPVASDSTPDDSSDYNEASVGLSTLSPLVRDSLMSFLLGSDAEAVMSAAMISALKSSGNELRFYSTSDLSGIMSIIQRHSTSALNSRKDRFGRWTDGYAATTPSCT